MEAERETQSYIIERELIKSYKTQLALMNASDDLIMLINREGSVEVINNVFSERLGLAPEAVRGRSVFELFTDVEKEKINRVFETREQQSFEHEFNSSVYLINYFPVLDEKGALMQIAIFIRDITRERHMEREIIKVSEEERQRIGSEIQEELRQQLSGMDFFISALRKRMAKKSIAEESLVEQIAELNKEIIERVNKIAMDLNPVTIERHSFFIALQKMLREIESLNNVKCSLHQDEELSIDNFTAINLYYIAYDAVDSALKYSNPGFIEVNVYLREGRFVMRIENDINTSPEEEAQNIDDKFNRAGISLIGYRAKLISADMNIFHENKKFVVEILQRN